MAVNVPLIHISDLAEQTTAADTDYMVIGGTDAKKIKYGTIFNLIKAKLGLGTAATKNVVNNLTTASAGNGVLDAYQGKVLKSEIDGLNSAFGNGVFPLVSLNGNVSEVFNRDIGIYISYTQNCNDVPTEVLATMSITITIVASSTWGFQYLFSAYKENGIYIRRNANGVVSSWEKLSL